jgi:hypothetical protein
MMSRLRQASPGSHRRRAASHSSYAFVVSGSAARIVILRIYIQHYDSERPHRGLALQTPKAPQLKSLPDGDVQRRDRLGGLIHEYYRAAA